MVSASPCIMNIEIDMGIIKKLGELLEKLSDSQERFCNMELERCCIIQTIPSLVETCRANS
jgi:hypothetical protein